MIFNNRNAPTTAQKIAAFERQRGIRLPDDYKAFLLEFNGGYLDRSNDYFEVGNWNSFAVEDMFGITVDPETSITTKRFSNFSAPLRSKFLQFAYAGGEPLFMDLRETSAHGKIYIRAHDSPLNVPALISDAGFEDAGDYEEATFLHPVADSFSEFTAMLGPEPE